MKQCLHCGNIHEAIERECPKCRFAPQMDDGFPSYATTGCQGGKLFPIGSFALLAKREAGSFWFRARNELIIWALGNFFSTCRLFLEIGCGTGFVLSGIEKAYPEMTLLGSEMFSEGLAFAASQVRRAELVRMDARSIPFVDHFDVIGAFDVLEHIEEDEIVLAQIRRALKPGGGLLLTVPQHPWLWSWTDDYSYHVRRYTAESLHAKLSRAGFDILLSTSFICCYCLRCFCQDFTGVRHKTAIRRPNSK